MSQPNPFPEVQEFLQAGGNPKVAQVMVAAAVVPMLEQTCQDMIKRGLQTSGFALLVSVRYPKLRPLALPGLICAASGVVILARVRQQRQAFMPTVASALGLDPADAPGLFESLEHTS